MTKAPMPRDLLDPLVDRCKPRRVILFGSKARDEATRNSDIDPLAIDASAARLRVSNREPPVG